MKRDLDCSKVDDEDDIINGLWPVELCKETDEATLPKPFSFLHRSKTVNTRFILEYALSSNSLCKECRCIIPFNSLRFGFICFNPSIGKHLVSFYHFTCFKRPVSFQTVEDVTILDTLTVEDKEKFAQFMNDASKMRKRRINNKNVNRKMKEFPRTPKKAQTRTSVFKIVKHLVNHFK